MLLVIITAAGCDPHRSYRTRGIWSVSTNGVGLFELPQSDGIVARAQIESWPGGIAIHLRVTNAEDVPLRVNLGPPQVAGMSGRALEYGINGCSVTCTGTMMGPGAAELARGESCEWSGAVSRAGGRHELSRLTLSHSGLSRRGMGVPLSIVFDAAD